MSGPAHLRDETYLIKINKEEEKEEINGGKEFEDYFKDYVEGEENENKEKELEDLEKFLAV